MAVKVLHVLADYDDFQFRNTVKPDCCNTGGLQQFDSLDDMDGPEGSWCDWFDEETGIDDVQEYVRFQESGVLPW